MTASAQQAQSIFISSRCLYNTQQVEAALDAMAQAISRDLHDRNPLILCVLTGAIIPMGHLLTRLDFPLEIDYIHATRYRGETAGGELHWLARPQTPMKDRVVLIVDDILDEGHTLAGLLEYCRDQQASEVYSAVLVEKHHDRRVAGLKSEYVGLDVDDNYVFGYGMDYKGYLRNAPGIYAVTEKN
ncbi:MAG: hypoxanthine-guanine phosphoribosyltransferase [Gammaproteobacteria bacterium]|nr:hypoxanthine-guanine phosphoribosyltransferase [Gammaproteobacteria bacterium]